MLYNIVGKQVPTLTMWNDEFIQKFSQPIMAAHKERDRDTGEFLLWVSSHNVETRGMLRLTYGDDRETRDAHFEAVKEFMQI